MTSADTRQTQSNLSPSAIGTIDSVTSGTPTVSTIATGSILTSNPLSGNPRLGLQVVGGTDELTDSTNQTKNVVAPLATDQRSNWREAITGLSRITINPAVSGGIPTIRDTRISVTQLIEVLVDVGSIGAVVDEFNNLLESSDIQEALLFTAKLAR